MVRLSAKTYNDLPQEIRDRAIFRLSISARNNRIALNRYKNDISLLNAVWKKMTDTEKNALTQVYESANVTVVETEKGVELERPKPTEYVKNTLKAIEKVDDVASSALTHAKEGIVTTGRKVRSGYDAVSKALEWYKKRNTFLKSLFTGIGSYLFLQFVKYYGGNANETLKQLSTNAVTIGGATVALGLQVSCLIDILPKIKQYIDLRRECNRQREIVEQAHADAAAIREAVRLNHETTTKLMDMITTERVEAQNMNEECIVHLMRQQSDFIEHTERMQDRFFGILDEYARRQITDVPVRHATPASTSHETPTPTRHEMSAQARSPSLVLEGQNKPPQKRSHSTDSYAKYMEECNAYLSEYE